jgi:hypothetical protein
MELKCTALTAIAYKHIFGCELLRDMKDISEDNMNTDVLVRLCYVEALGASGITAREIMGKTTDDFYDWLMEQPPLEANKEILTQVINTWVGNQKTTSKAKNLNGRQSVK